MKDSVKKTFRITERRGKGGTITVIKHCTNGFRTLVISGYCKTKKGLNDSSFLKQSIYSIGYDILHRFPDFLKQGANSTIFSYTLPAVEDRDTLAGLKYSFQYILNGGSDTETAIKKVLSQLEKINNEITACTKLGL